MNENAKPGLRMRMPKLLLSLLLILFASILHAQQITGTVSGEDGEKLPGVSVIVKGTTRATLTDDAGKFTINASGKDVIEFTSIGFAKKEVPVNGKQTIAVTMASDARNLEDVVVTALGIKRESKKLGYSATTANVGELQQNRTTNFANALQGKVAGLDITPPSSGAGASTKIRLRGQTNFAGESNSPLLIVNGLPLDQGANGANGGNSRDNGDNLLLFNPDDIESMTVLKGATAAALYGSRAGNGAIVITTKSGSKNAGIGVEFTSNFTAEEVLDLTDFQYEFGQGVNGMRPTTQGAAINSGQFGWGERYDGVPTIQFDGVSRPYEAHKGRIKEFFRTGTSANNTLAFSGGNAKGSFRLSYSDLRAKGISPTNEYLRKVVNLGVNHNLTEKLSIQLNLNYTNEKSFNPPQVGVQGQGSMNFITRTSPTVPLEVYKEKAVNDAGNERQTTGFAQTLINPYWLLPRQSYIDRDDRLLGTVTLRYNFAKWLYAQGRVSMDYNNSFLESNDPAGTGSPANAQFYDNTRTTYGGSYNVNQGSARSMNYEGFIGGSHSIGDFSFDGFIGGNILTNSSRGINTGAQGFVVRDLYSIGNGTVFSQGFGFSESGVNSVFGSAEFGYRNLLFLNVTGRNDWFSVLNPKTNSYFYPSVSGSFVFSELLKSATWLNYGKLRGSWADVASAAGVAPYYGNLNYNFNQLQYMNYTIGSIATANAPNPFITPFSVKEKEIGIDVRMFGSRVNLDIAAYDKRTDDQIMDAQISAASGYTATKINNGRLQNRGIEFMLDVVPVRTRDFSWNSTFNTAYNKTKVLALSPGQERIVVADWYNGGASNEFMGMLVYQVGEELNQISAKTYRRNEDGQILVGANGRLLASSQNVLFGSALPKFVGGWNNTFRYKGLSLLVHFDYKAGGKMLSGSALNNLRQGHSKASLVGRRQGENGVVFPGFYANGAEAGKPNTTAVFGQQFYADYRTLQIADPFIYKSDYIKLRNVTLTYDFTKLIGSKFNFVKGLQLSASCRNVALIKKHVPDIDPEQVASSGDFRSGYEAVALPTTRNYGLNLNVKF